MSITFYIPQWTVNHRWISPVLRYLRNMVIYHYPLIGVVYMIILHVFIIKNGPNLFSNYYPNSTIRLIYPFILNFGEFIYKVSLPEDYSIAQEETEMIYYFGIMFYYRDTMISKRNHKAIISIICT